MLEINEDTDKVSLCASTNTLGRFICLQVRLDTGAGWIDWGLDNLTSARLWFNITPTLLCQIVHQSTLVDIRTYARFSIIFLFRFINSDFKQNSTSEIHENSCQLYGKASEIEHRNQFIHVETDPTWRNNVSLVIQMYADFFVSSKYNL